MAESFIDRLNAARQAPTTNSESKPLPAGVGTGTAYGLTALAGEVAALVAVPIGSGRNDALNRASFRVGQLVAGGELAERHAIDTLGAADGGLDYPATRSTILSGIAAGRQEPRSAPDKTANTPREETQTMTAPKQTGDPLEWGNGVDYVDPRGVVYVYSARDDDGTIEHTATVDVVQPTPPRKDSTSWSAVDLTGILAGTDEPERPEFVTRTDGHALFYRGKVNYILGASESGKTWLALYGIVQALQAGKSALYIDFEDSARTAVHRLRCLGATDEDLTRFVYAHPDESLAGADAAREFEELLVRVKPDFVLIDSFNEALSIFGLMNTGDDIPRFLEALPRLIVKRTGACVVVIDHTRKNNTGAAPGGIGSQGKRSGQSGSAVTVETVAPFAPGTRGASKLTVDKDRPGGLRAESKGGKHVGTFVMDETTRGELVVQVHGPESSDAASRDTVRPTTLMERISEHLEALTEPQSQRAVADAVTGGARGTRIAALKNLAAEGYAHVDTAGRYSSIRPYRQSGDPMSDCYDPER